MLQVAVLFARAGCLVHRLNFGMKLSNWFGADFPMLKPHQENAIETEAA